MNPGYSENHPPLPPPPPRACFGRDELIEKIVCLVEGLTPIDLIGAGGIGKTSVALAILHDDRIKKWFDEDRRFSSDLVLTRPVGRGESRSLMCARDLREARGYN